MDTLLSNDYMIIILKYLVRIVTISTFGLSTAYFTTYQMKNYINDKYDDIIAFLSMLFASTIITFVYFYDPEYVSRLDRLRYFWEILVFAMLGNVVYIVVGKEIKNVFIYYIKNKNKKGS